jgi:hypothetical protein
MKTVFALTENGCSKVDDNIPVQILESPENFYLPGSRRPLIESSDIL